jgi:hypothetical protein
MLRSTLYIHLCNTIGCARLCFLISFLFVFAGCTATFECECTRYKKHITGSSTSVTISKIRSKNLEAARKKCEGVSDSVSSWGKEEKVNCKLRQK